MRLSDIIADNCQGLSVSDEDFMLRMYSSGLDVYKKRLEALAFDSGSILDAGCGFGQWSLSMAEMGANVASVDVSPVRADFLQKVAEQWVPGKVSATAQQLDKLCFDDNIFDKVFCYGVVFLTPWRESLKEMARVLKPEGVLYVNANGFGWYKNLWYNQPNKVKGYDPSEKAAKVLMNTWNYRKGFPLESGLDILIEPEELLRELKKLGFSDVVQGGEGELRARGREEVEAKSFFESEYYNDLGVYEVLAVKN